MLTNYLTIAWRTLWRHRTTTAINLLGLAVSLAVCFLMVLFLHQQWELDRFHPNADRIYRVATTYSESGNRTARAPLPLAAVLRDQASGVTAATQFTSANTFLVNNTFVVKGETSVSVEAFYADTSFFDVFPGFQMQAGDRHAALRDPNTAVLTADAARRLFGPDADPLGSTFSLEGTETFTVTGVLAPTAGPTHLDRDVFLSYATLAPSTLGPGDWDNLSRWTYVRLAEGTAPDAIAQFANDALQRDAPARDAAAYQLRLESLSDVRFGGIQMNAVSSRTQIPIYIYYFFLAIAVIVLLAAGFNYVNLTTAQSLERAKEIGVRKTLGANRTQLGAQFIGESVLLCLLAAVGACVLLYTLVPLFSQLYFFELLELPPLTVSLLEEPELLLLFGVVTVLFGLAAGSYPAFVLSSSRPAGVLGTSAEVSSPFGRLSVRTLLIGAQFAFALLLVVTATTLYRQSAEMAETNHLLRTDNALTVALQDVDHDRFRRAARRLAEVEDVTVVDNLPFSDSWRRRYIRTGADEASLLTFEYHSDTSFVRAMGVRLAASQTDWAVPFMANEGVLLNESAVRALGWVGPSEAVGATVFLNQTDDGEPIHPRRVVGVLENFQFRGSYHLYAGVGGPHVPPLMLQRGNRPYRTAVVHAASDDLAATRDRLETMWTAELETDYPFQARFYSDVIRERYGPLQDLASVVGFIAGLAILITLLGLLSIAAHHVKTRTKEIGIRKALGATASSLVVLLSQNYLRLVGIAAALTLPAAWYLNAQWLQYLPGPVSVGSGVMIGAVSGLFLLALLTVGSQTLRAARVDPTTTLRDE
jgi:putative ABC transport system permease protein